MPQRCVYRVWFRCCERFQASSFFLWRASSSTLWIHLRRVCRWRCRYTPLASCESRGGWGEHPPLPCNWGQNQGSHQGWAHRTEAQQWPWRLHYGFAIEKCQKSTLAYLLFTISQFLEMPNRNRGHRRHVNSSISSEEPPGLSLGAELGCELLLVDDVGLLILSHVLIVCHLLDCLRYLWLFPWLPTHISHGIN